MRPLLLILCLQIPFGACAVVPRVVPDDAAVGRMELVELRSEVFGNSRTLRVWLPPAYDRDEEELYPVLYLNDGQNLFDRSTSQFSEYEWEVDETAARLIRDGRIPPVVVVGIDNAGKRDRPREYLPWEDSYLTPAEPDPRGRDYPRFLLGEVVPFIENRYRVLTGSEHRYLGGSSYGGLITVFTATRSPGEFAGLLVESPSLYVNEAAVLTNAEAVTEWPGRIYIGIGTHEGQSECRNDNYVRDAVADVRRLQAILETSPHPPDLHVEVERCGLHSERYWAKRLPRGLTFLFGPDE